MRIEEEYQNIVVEYLDGLCVIDESIRFTAIEPSLYLSSERQKGRKKKMGVRPGFPDLLIVMPPMLFFIEMKKENSTMTNEQPNVFPKIQECNVPVFIAHDPIEALDIIHDMMDKTGRNNFI